MADAGIALVRMGEFAWLDRAVELLAAKGIRTVMGTPTATPPKWLCDEAEAAGGPVYQVDREGRRRGFGTRRHVCHTNPRYLDESQRIVRAQVEHFAGNANLVAWQIDNEFGCFDWDEGNVGKNRESHKVSPREAEQVLFNSPLIVADDVKHSGTERRYFVLGQTDEDRPLFVAFTIRGNLIRVISARDMSRRERKVYQG